MKHFLHELLLEVERRVNTRYPKRFNKSIIDQTYYDDFFFDEEGTILTIENALTRVPSDAFLLSGNQNLKKSHFRELDKQAWAAIQREDKEIRAADQPQLNEERNTPLKAEPQRNPQRQITAATLQLPRLGGSRLGSQVVAATLGAPPLWPGLRPVPTQPTHKLLPSRFPTGVLPPPVIRNIGTRAP